MSKDIERLTSNKPVEEMSMVELAHNCCYAKDRLARYRDFEMDMDARDFARNLMTTLTDDELPLDDDNFDEEILENLMYDPFSNVKGLIALFYRNLWAMADIRERLKEYEDAEEQGLFLPLSVKPGDTVYCWRHAVPTRYYNYGVERWLQTDNELIPARVVSVKVTKSGTFMKLALKGKCLVKQTWDGGMETYEDYEYCHYTMTIGALGKTVFLTKEEAEQALKQMGE